MPRPSGPCLVCTTRAWSILLLVTTLGAVSSPTRVTWADEAADKTRAEEHFQQGRRLAQAGRVAEACIEFSTSYSIDPAAGTLLNLAECHENEGRLASAFQEFTSSIEIAKAKKRDDRVLYATEHLERIRPRLSYLTLTVPRESVVAGLEVRLDGTTIPESDWGTEQMIDPGPHAVKVLVKGRSVSETVVTIGAVADRKEHVVKVPTEAEQKAAESRAKKKAAAVHTTVKDPAANQDSSSSRATLRMASYITGGVGLLSLAVSTGFILQTDALKNEMASYTAQGNETAANEKWGQAHDAQMVTRITFGVGLVAIATGVVLYVISAPRHPEAAKAQSTSLAYRLIPGVDKSGGGATLMVSF